MRPGGDYRHPGVLYLKRKNEQVDNEAMLNRLNIKWEHEKLARFGHGDAGEWDDASYTEERFVHWGSGTEGYDELRAIVAQWRIHIELGKMAAKVLCEYIDSRIHCFDNTQDTHPQRADGKLDRSLLTELADRQAERLAPVLEKYAVGRARVVQLEVNPTARASTLYNTHVISKCGCHGCTSCVRTYAIHSNMDAPFAGMTGPEVRTVCPTRL